MRPSEAAQAACDKLSFTDSDTVALAKKFAVRRYGMIWDSCLWNDTLGVLSINVSAASDVVTMSDPVSSTYASISTRSMFMDLPVAVRLNLISSTDNSLEIPAADWQSFFQLDPNVWSNVDSRRATPSNFVNMPRAIDTVLYGQSGVPRIKLVPVPDQDCTLFILGKKQSVVRQFGEAQAVANDDPFEIRGCENAIMAFVEGDLLEYSRQYGKAQAKYGEAAAHVGTMKDMERNQQQQVSRIIPDSLNEWTIDDIP